MHSLLPRLRRSRSTTLLLYLIPYGNIANAEYYKPNNKPIAIGLERRAEPSQAHPQVQTQRSHLPTCLSIAVPPLRTRHTAIGQ